MKKRILVMAVAMVFLATMVWAEEPNFYTNTWSVGPERWFKDGKEVAKGTPGAVNGDELARQRIMRETPPEITRGMITGLAWWQREAIEAQVYELRNRNRVFIYFKND